MCVVVLLLIGINENRWLNGQPEMKERKGQGSYSFIVSTGFKRHPFPATPPTPSSLSSSKTSGGKGGKMFSIHWPASFQGQKLFCRKKRIGLIDMHCKAALVVNRTTWATLGAGIAQWLEHRTRDWKVAGSNPCWNGGRIFFSRVDFLCWLLFRYPFHPRVTAVARKKSRSFCQKVQVAGYS